MINEEASKMLFDCMDTVYNELKKYTEYSARDVNTNFSTEYLHLNSKALDSLNDFMMRKDMKVRYKLIKEISGLSEGAIVTILKWSCIQIYFYQLIDFLDEQLVRNNIIFNCGVYTSKERTAIKMLPTLSSIVEHLESFEYTPGDIGTVISYVIKNWITPYMIDENNEGLRIKLKDSALKYKYQLANNPEQIDELKASIKEIIDKYTSLSKTSRHLASMQSTPFNLFSFIEKDYRIRQDILSCSDASFGPSIYNSIILKRCIDNKIIYVVNQNAKVNIDKEKLQQDFKDNVTYDKLYELNMLSQIVISKHIEPCIYSIETILNDDKEEKYDELHRVFIVAHNDYYIATKCSGLQSNLNKHDITNEKMFNYWQMFVLYKLGVTGYTEDIIKELFIINPQCTDDEEIGLEEKKHTTKKLSSTDKSTSKAEVKVDLSYIETDKNILNKIASDRTVLVFGEAKDINTGSKHSHHKEPVEHIRREHLRHMKSGKVVKVRQSIVNKGNK